MTDIALAIFLVGMLWDSTTTLKINMDAGVTNESNPLAAIIFIIVLIKLLI